MMIRNITKSEQIMTELKRLISEGSYKSGDKFPSENALAGQFHTTQLTMNKVTSQLVAEGLLIRKQGVGTFIQKQKKLSFDIIVENMYDNEATKLEDSQVEILQGILKSCNEKDISFNFLPFYNDEKTESILAGIKSGEIASDGHIFLKSQGYESLIGNFEKENINYVIFDYLGEKHYNTVVKERKKYIISAMEAVKSLGVNKIAFLGEEGKENTYDSIKYNSFIEGVDKLGFKKDFNYKLTGFDKGTGRDIKPEVAKKIISELEKSISSFQAVFIERNPQVNTVVEYLNKIDRTDIVLMVFGNVRIRTRYKGSLLMVQSDYTGFGKELVSFLERRINGDVNKKVLFPCELALYQNGNLTSMQKNKEGGLL
ncbi:MAG: hypothetical protein A2231_05750 [Candidatus Firestonebacteria bacterium RIFOXYA2_FULL_40_8]|nr:MAG: hypothetical protein A2231_05750 [Candidatus Firestonebacteria bacterium RIFOXYA2_FULL_40_8]